MATEEPRELLDVRIRPAGHQEGERLKEIATAAKSYWGYDPEWVRRWVAMGGFSSAALQAREVYVAENQGRAIGWDALIPKNQVCWLDDLWVEPGWIGRGVGSLLFRHAVERATELGAISLEWEADPHAVGFYQKMGAGYLRDSEETEWGRVLPVMGVALTTP